ncbi:MAG: CPBP family intramembrane metalloprotease [Actinomycetota bacterium]|nr:CPBP family intramembrane metalloprotease [Actinomycetota bacterium]
MPNLFRNAREKRLRAFWRLLLHYTLYSYLSTVLVIVSSLVFLAVSEGTVIDMGTGASRSTSPALFMSGYVASLVAALASVWLAGRFLDRRPFSGFGLRPDRAWWPDFCFGLALGAVLMTAVFFVELAVGWITITGAFEIVGEGSSFALSILFVLVAFVCVGFYEELLSRGYQLQNMAEGLNFPSLGPKGAVLLAWALSSTIFGLLHLRNPGASLASTSNIAIAGLFLGAGYVLTGRLAIPIGLHITWNFFQGNVFGFPVSGIGPIGATFVSIEQGGPLLLTGGTFGPEAGLLGTTAMTVGSLLIWLWVRARHGEATIQTSIADPPINKTQDAKVLNDNYYDISRDS